MQINQTFFDTPDHEALEFYRSNGYVCFRKAVDDIGLQRIESGWRAIVDKYANDIGVDADAYLGVISQWRDIWKEEQFFHELLAGCLSQCAAWGLELDGTRLMHDQLICKSMGGGNGEIPWHQDSMYWPTDRTGCATWLAIDDVGKSNGCLEVVPGSHFEAPGQPVDFMADGVGFSLDQIVAVPVRAGDLVLLNSTAWHRTKAMVDGDVRLAHVTFWLPPQTTYTPEKSLWHPVNKQVSVSAGELLNEDEFPVFGERAEGYGSSRANSHQGVAKASGMYNARSQIELMVQKHTGATGSLGNILSDIANRRRLAEKYSSVENSFEECLCVIEQVWISAAAFEQHRSRNVFLSAYKEWEILFGFDG